MALTAAGLLLVSSCSNDEMMNQVGEGNVTFTLEVPACLSTRAFGDGQKALDLTYAVYESGSKTPIIVSQNEVHFTDLKANVTLKLVNGKSYDFVWWAQSPEASCYEFDAATQTVKVDYTGIQTNDETRDAFFQHSTFKVTGPVNETVRLYRPFAQVNFGTNDLDEVAVKAAFGEDYSALTTSLTATAYTSLNLFTEEATGEKAVTFAAAGIPADETFPVAGYDYLSMDYLLMTKDQELQDITFSVLENGTQEFNKISISNVPFQRNYRTNIFGQLLTSTNEYNIVIEPDFETPDFMVSTEEELADAVKHGGNIVLNKDITLTKPLALVAGVPAMITLNGNTLGSTCRHTVKAGEKLVIDGTKADGSHSKIDLNTNYLAGFMVTDGGDLELTGLDVKYTGNVPNNNSGSLLNVGGTGSKLTLKDCNLDPANSSMYAISTNASVADQHVNINLERVSIKPSVILATPVLINIPCHVVAKDCEFEGCNQAAVLRGGDYVFDNCSFTQTLAFDGNGNCITTKNDIKSTFRNLRRNGWGTGDAVPLAGVTMGNHSNSYQYPTVVEMKGCTVNIPDVAKNDGDIQASLPAVYIYANQGSGLGVTFTYDEATKINGELEVASSNITVNGNSK